MGNEKEGGTGRLPRLSDRKRRVAGMRNRRVRAGRLSSWIGLCFDGWAAAARSCRTHSSVEGRSFEYLVRSQLFERGLKGR